jgi:hypothetical protein
VRGLGRGHALAILGLLAAGVLIRLTVIAGTDGVGFDMGSFRIVLAALREEGLGVYDAIHPSRWPYPPGYFPWILTAGELGERPPLEFQSWIRMAPVAADVGLALLAASLLGRFGASPRRRVAAVAAVALGPIFVGVSSYNGQLDPVAILPAVAALWVWTRPDQARRALYAGLLIGVGASVKTVPILMVLALAPSARSRREAAVMAGAAAAVLSATMAPFVLATPGEALLIFSYHGVPGFGGISLLVQPEFPVRILAGIPVQASDALLFMRDHGHQVTLIPALALLGAYLLRRRVEPVRASVLLWLTVWAFGGNFFLQYLVWGLPFLLVAGYLRAVAAIQVALFVPLLITYNATVPEGLAVSGYRFPVVCAWVAALVALFVLVRRGAPAPATARPRTS